MQLKLIFCSDEEGGIGLNNTIPWHSSEDFKHFKEYTTGTAVLMGYNTWLSLPKKPLPNRLNIVVSRTPVPKSTEENVMFIDEETMYKILQKKLILFRVLVVIGGSWLYNIAVPYADEISHSIIKGTYGCDRFFKPDLSEFKLKNEQQLSTEVMVRIYGRK